MTEFNKKPKLLVVTSTFPRWRNDTDPPFVYELCKRLTDSFAVTIHTPHYTGAKVKEVRDGMCVHRFRYFFSPLEKLAGSTGILPTLRRNKMYYLLLPFLLLAQFVSLLLLVRKVRPDVIHAHWLIPQGFIAVLTNMLSGVPVVVTAHGADVFGLQGALCKVIKKFILCKVDEISVVSKSLADALADCINPDIAPQIIPMGVDCTVFHPQKGRDIIRDKYAVAGPFLLYVGRLTEKKGVRYLINAMPAVFSEMPAANLLIVGSGELDQELRDQVTAMKLNNQVRFAGSIPNADLPAYYADADIFVGPSIRAEGGDREGFGLTFVEAAMSGCLIIGTKTGGIKDIIQDNKTGFLVPEKNENALAEKILYALNCKKETENMKEAGRNRCIKKYDWGVIAKRYEHLLLQAAV